MILCIRTDSEIAQLYLYKHNKDADNFSWHSDRRLANELLPKIEEFLQKNKTKLSDLKAIVVFTGKGSFTGLRIGTTVANTLAYGLNIVVVSGQGKHWQMQGINKMSKAKLGNFVIPKYDKAPNITKPKA